MSNLWRHEKAGEATSVGSFAIWSKPAPFRPWAGAGTGDGNDDPCDETLSDHVVAADIDAFAEGFAAGRRTVEQEMAQERAALADLARTLETLQPEPPEPLAALLAETVERLVRQIVGEVAVDPALLMRRTEAAARLISDEVAPSKLRVHPDDIAFIDPALIAVPVVADPLLERGSIVLETASGWIEDGPSVRLDRLRAELDRIGPDDE